MINRDEVTTVDDLYSSPIAKANENPNPTLQSAYTDAVSPAAFASGVVTATLTGGMIQTAQTGRRIVLDGLSEDNKNQILFYNDADLIAAKIIPVVSGNTSGFRLSAVNPATEAITHQIEVSYDSVTGQKNISPSFGIGATDLGGTTTLTVSGSFANNLSPDADVTRDLGSSSRKWDDGWFDEVHYNTLTAISDKRTKKNIRAFNERGIDDVSKLKAKKFVRKENNQEEIGFIAQDVQEIMPELVKPYDICDDEGNVIETRFGIDTSALITVLVNSVQELTARVKTLETKHGK